MNEYVYICIYIYIYILLYLPSTILNVFSLASRWFSTEAPGEPRPQEFQLRVQNSIFFWSDWWIYRYIYINGGGNSHILYFHPEDWGTFPIWRAYFSNGLKPPTRYINGDWWSFFFFEICELDEISKDPSFDLWIFGDLDFASLLHRQMLRDKTDSDQEVARLRSENERLQERPHGWHVLTCGIIASSDFIYMLYFGFQ